MWEVAAGSGDDFEDAVEACEFEDLHDDRAGGEEAEEALAFVGEFLEGDESAEAAGVEEFEVVAVEVDA